ncbi:PilZ domain-containing protein [Vibrio campbellii]|uniref:PilZ domain-containing protein n=1 Tax=Vibrio campbellii TaxID=680 RepID=UPI0005F0987D|nr:PilZ domain-containing protein [Vibrio campbellii]
MPSTHTNDELHKFLKTGMRVSINFEFGPEEKYIYAATYLGLKENAYIILDIPTRLLEEQALRKLNNVDVVIRGVSDTDLGHVVAFKTSVLMNLLRPSPLLFVRIPATFATKPVRGHERYKLQLACTIDHMSNRYESNLVDFSLSGCGISTLIEPEFAVGDTITIESPLSGYIDEENRCSVANIKKLQKGWIVGVKFAEPLNMTDDLKNELLEHSFSASMI